MRLVVEAGHGVVRLRLKPRAGEASARHRLEHRKASAAHEPVHERGDEHGLAGAGEAGDAEPDGRLPKIAAEFHQRARGQASLFDELRGAGRHRPRL